MTKPKSPETAVSDGDVLHQQFLDSIAVLKHACREDIASIFPPPAIATADSGNWDDFRNWDNFGNWGNFGNFFDTEDTGGIQRK